MDDDFDPYRKWLGIPPEEQPPDHYRLLGIARFEDDPDVIESAADRQMAHVRTFQTGKRSSLSQGILNELSAAKGCLLDRGRKQQYDEELRGAPEATETVSRLRPGLSATPRPLPPGAHATPTPGAPVAPVAIARSRPVEHEVVSVPGPIRLRRRSSPAPIIGAVAAIGFLGLLVLVVIQLLADPGDQESKTSSHRPAVKKIKPAPPLRSGAKGDSEPRSEKSKLRSGTPRPIESQPVPTTPAVDNDPSPPETPTDAEKTETDKPLAKDATEPVAKKPAPPSKSAIEKAVRKVKEEYRPSLAKAKTFDERIALAQELLDRAEEPGIDPLLQYALLSVVREIAEILASPETFCAAIDFMAERFSIDALQQKRLSFEEAAKEAHRPEQYRDLIEHAQQLTRQALAAERLEPAEAFARTARVLAKKLTDPKDRVEIVPRVEALVVEVTDHEKELKNYQKFAKQLATEPDDPAANLAVGRYLCVVKRDWPSALKHLAKSAQDSKYKELADKELADPKEPMAQIELADGWIVLGKRQGGVYKTAFYERAKLWLTKAAEQLPDAEKEKLRPKQEEIERWMESGS